MIQVGFCVREDFIWWRVRDYFLWEFRWVRGISVEVSVSGILRYADCHTGDSMMHVGLCVREDLIYLRVRDDFL